MPVSAPDLLDTQRAFDGVARTYGEDNERNPILSAMRLRAMDALISVVPPGASLLDLGCGPGLDAEYLARRGYRVVGVDWSPEMVRQASARIRRAGLEERVGIHHVGIHELHRVSAHLVDGAYSNFGALNCVPDLETAARAVADRLSTGGLFVASIIGRVCPWELALYGIRRDWKRAAVRYAPDFVPVPLEGRTIWTRYYKPREFERALHRAGFETLSRRALGLLVPPPYLSAFACRHPKLIRVLQGIEDRVAGRPVFREWGDHFLIVMRKAS